MSTLCKEEWILIFQQDEVDTSSFNRILVVGCNGVGKTTVLEDIKKYRDTRNVLSIDLDHFGHWSGGAPWKGEWIIPDDVFQALRMLQGNFNIVVGGLCSNLEDLIHAAVRNGFQIVYLYASPTVIKGRQQQRANNGSNKPVESLMTISNKLEWIESCMYPYPHHEIESSGFAAENIISLFKRISL